VRARVNLIFLLFLPLASAMLGDAVDVAANPNDISEQDTFDADDLDLYVTPPRSAVVRNRPQRDRSSARMSIGASPRREYFLALGRIKNPFGFSQQDLHSFQMVFRI
jgi:hypothetical protein